jgi:RNA polymerase II subunit A small phosphatase-like protein
MTRNLLIFDLDETLVHATTEQLPRPADFKWQQYHVYKRPHVSELLSQVNVFFDFAVWSSSSCEYVDEVVERVFGTDFEVKFAWDIDRCIQRVHAQSNGYVYIKDLRKVQSQGYPVERILIVDDSPEKIARQPRNHIKIKPYVGQIDDIELLTLAVDLAQRAKMLG